MATQADQDPLDQEDHARTPVLTANNQIPEEAISVEPSKLIQPEIRSEDTSLFRNRGHAKELQKLKAWINFSLSFGIVCLILLEI